MSEPTVKPYLFNNIPGTHKSWTLAVFATSLHDATSYVRAYNGGGKYCGVASEGEVKAHCGAVTDRARLVYAAANERLMGT